MFSSNFSLHVQIISTELKTIQKKLEENSLIDRSVSNPDASVIDGRDQFDELIARMLFLYSCIRNTRASMIFSIWFIDVISSCIFPSPLHSTTRIDLVEHFFPLIVIFLFIQVFLLFSFIALFVGLDSDCTYVREWLVVLCIALNNMHKISGTKFTSEHMTCFAFLHAHQVCLPVLTRPAVSCGNFLVVWALRDHFYHEGWILSPISN